MSWNIHAFWRFPLRIGIALAALYHWLGWPAFVGLGVMAILGPLTGFALSRPNPILRLTFTLTLLPNPFLAFLVLISAL